MNLHQFAPKMGPQWGVETRKLQSSLARLLQIMSNPEGEFRPLGRFRPSRWASSLITVVRRWGTLNQARSVKLRIALLSSACSGSTEPGVYPPVH